jgi:hypothetical protein
MVPFDFGSGPFWKPTVASYASSEYSPVNRHGAVADFGRIVMGIRFSGMLLAVVTTAFVIAPGLSALAQFNLPGVGGSNTTSDRMGGGGGKASGSAAKTTTINNSKSNNLRMGGGGGGKGAAGVTTVKSSKSNTSDRMGGGGGKGKSCQGSTCIRIDNEYMRR